MFGDDVEAYWQDDARNGHWWPARVLKVLVTRYRVTFHNYDSSWDMVLSRRYVRHPRVRTAAAAADTGAADDGESADGETDSYRTSESEELGGGASDRSDTSSESGGGDNEEDGNDAEVGEDAAGLEFRSKEGRVWTTGVPDQFVRAPARNIIRVNEGNKGHATQIGCYVDAFKCLIDDAMIAEIVRYTTSTAV